jgi:hypothetical protein
VPCRSLESFFSRNGINNLSRDARGGVPLLCMGRDSACPSTHLARSAAISISTATSSEIIETVSALLLKTNPN